MKAKFGAGDTITCPCGTDGFDLVITAGSVQMIPGRQFIDNVEFPAQTFNTDASDSFTDYSGTKFIADGSFSGTLSLRGIFGTRPKQGPRCE